MLGDPASSSGPFFGTGSVSGTSTPSSSVPHVAWLRKTEYLSRDNITRTAVPQEVYVPPYSLVWPIHASYLPSFLSRSHFCAMKETSPGGSHRRVTSRTTAPPGKLKMLRKWDECHQKFGAEIAVQEQNFLAKFTQNLFQKNAAAAVSTDLRPSTPPPPCRGL